MNNESTSILDVVDGQVLAFGELHDDFLIGAPFLTSEQSEKNWHENKEPEEARHEDGQQEEVLVNEDRLLVALHFHVHHHHHRGECKHAHNVKQISGEITIGTSHDYMNSEDNDQYGVDRDGHFLVISISFVWNGIDGNKADAEEVKYDAMVDWANSTLERWESKEFLTRPNLVDSVRVLHFFLLNSLFVESRRDFVSINVAEKLQIIKKRQQIGSSHDAFERPVV